MFRALKAALGIRDFPEMTREDVARHNTADSLWIVAGDAIYDVTDFVHLHPGGAVAIVKRGGGCTDCKQDYKFHSKGAREQWQKYQVGVLSSQALDSRVPVGAAPSPAVLASVAKPLHYGDQVEGAAKVPPSVPPPVSLPSVLLAEFTPEVEDLADGGEDCVAVGRCCKAASANDACKSCPRAPACVRQRSTSAMSSEPSDVQALSPLHSNHVVNP